MAALLTSELGNQVKLLKYISCCLDMGIDVQPPSVNYSTLSFSAHNDKVVFGLAGIKGCGDEAVRNIIHNRKDGPYVSLLDLCERVNLRKVGKRVLEALIKSGACDDFGASRQAMLASLDLVLAKAQKRQKTSSQGMPSLFDFMPKDMEVEKLTGVGIDCEEASLPEFSEEFLLKYEKEYLGFYLTSHPLQNYMREIRRIGCRTLENALEALQREGGGWLRVRSVSTAGYYSLVVGNCCTRPLRSINGRYLSSKAPGRFGIGLSTVQSVARRCGGQAEFTVENGEFRASVFLPRPKPETSPGRARPDEDEAVHTVQI